MDRIMISIHHKWWEMEKQGIKDIEVRKKIPNCTRPFSVVVYEPKTNGGSGKVVGEFICDKAYMITPNFDCGHCNQYDMHFCHGQHDPCLSFNELDNYLKGNKGYCWHISDLKIYDNPKELSEFNMICPYCNTEICYSDCKYGDFDIHNKFYCDRKVKKPPQSWCYIEG